MLEAIDLPLYLYALLKCQNLRRPPGASDEPRDATKETKNERQKHPRVKSETDESFRCSWMRRCHKYQTSWSMRLCGQGFEVRYSAFIHKLLSISSPGNCIMVHLYMPHVRVCLFIATQENIHTLYKSRWERGHGDIRLLCLCSPKIYNHISYQYASRLF